MIQRCHAAGILFCFIDEKQDKWVLIGRRKEFPAKDKWSIPIIRCSPLLKEKNASYDYKKTAMLASEKEIGIEITNENELILLGVKKSLHYKFFVYTYRLPNNNLPPLKNDFHMVMWSKIDDVPKPTTMFFGSLLNKYKNC
jgi:hypothetical protein